MMKLYNQLTKKIENFEPKNPNEVKVYTCGPTVYSYPHIGNYAAYIYWDFLTRALEFNGYKIKRVINLTDVGHLVSDADEGEDKLEKGAKREHKTVWEIADFYIKDFLENYHALNLLEPHKFARATGYIKEEEELVDALTEKGCTYEIPDGVYYDTSKFPTYADFARLDLENLKAGARVDFSSDKRNVSDFAVWKFVKPGEDHTMQWQYLDKPGYPGWHLECSAIIHKELGETIDIHTGGVDHIPIHHTNEIAQSEAAYGKKLSYFWMHCDFITIDGQKISKSLGNVYDLKDLAERGFSPMDYKIWVLQGHYRGDRNFTFADLAAAKTRHLNWRNRIAASYQKRISDNKEAMDKITAAVSDDLNSAAAFAIIDNSKLSTSDWARIDQLFGLNLINDSPDINDEVKQLISDREEARKNKDYAKSDEIRDKLVKLNITIKDTPDGSIWQYLN
ncbi:cysteine--tRNA ligase [Candidatus Saccharibacteria bacterium]|nr:cysteine--tRNA ligase [Candidatus Saccharibacteria bacterium]